MLFNKDTVVTYRNGYSNYASLFARSFIKGMLLLFMMALCSFSLQANIVNGYVYDAQTGETLPGVHIYIKGTTTGTISDAEGFYQMPILNEGTHIIVASYIGYANKEEEIVVEEYGILEHNFQLSYGGYMLSEVSITVQAKGQLKAINQQINSLSISNIISSERIREVPDATAAESVGRLPGVSVINDNGEGNKVVVRGMDPRFNLVTINGVRAPSTDQNDNSVGMAGISPFMIDGIEVQKSLTPDRDGDAIGGIVDLKLKDAEEGFKTNIVVQNNSNSLIRDSYLNPRATLQLSNRFFNNKLGVILVGNYENIDRSSQRMELGTIEIQDLQETDKYIRWQTATFSQNNLNRERFGGSIFLDYRLPAGKISINNFTSGLTNTGHNISESFIERGRNFNRVNTIHEGNTLSMVNNLKIEHQLFFNSTIDFSASYTSAYSKNPVNHNITQSFTKSEADVDGFFPASLNYILSDNNVDPFDYALITPYLRNQSFYLSSMGADDNTFDENELTIRANWKIPVPTFSRHLSGYFKFGGQYRDKSRKFDKNQRGASLTTGGADAIRQRIIELNPDLNFDGLTEYVHQNLPSYYFIDNDLNQSILDDKFTMQGFIDPIYMSQLINSMEHDNWSSVPGGIKPYQQIFEDYSGNEKIYAGYGMTEFNISKYILLVGGVRYEKLETNYKSFGVYELGQSEATIEEFGDDMARKGNEYWLPMINMRIKPLSWLDLRLAYTQSIARPQYYSFMPRYRVDRNGEMTNIGNPDLLPALSENFDVYLSFLKNKLGLFTVGAFYKVIEGYEFTKNYPHLTDADNEVHPYDVIATRRNPFAIPINNPYDAFTKGIEVDWQTVLWYLPKPLNGLVFNINYTYMETSQTQTVVLLDRTYPDPLRPWIFEITKRDSIFERPLFNQPRGIINVSLGYDLGGFSARVAYNRRTSVFLGEIGGERDKVENIKEGNTYSQWDLSLTQFVPKVPGLQVTFNMTNISNSFNEESIGNSNTGGRFPTRQEFYGRIIILGLRYSI